ncbi:hypothetical protein MROS_1533 [Melioribacter roseus P3M-2]|jgi:hypothetical protein|uniref:Outer membrane protein beta-barrel domain-containing protein n=1 Tax=Melioribacter roseus (strain DSM 23840 / JCM 17771 / VKM B-2668 / P3M-2) TaxID=1191523 RepID=I6Z6H9_MELRP|nr:hypothetical protein [Melioribacter roseus]AFN74770.1 hypothetical protein MROS_1533 [Melioribacter roseus P3M-2]
MIIISIKKIYRLILCSFLLSTACYPQNHSLGFKIEPFLFFSKTEGTGAFAYKQKDETGIYLTSFYLSYTYHLSEIFSSNTVAGYLWTNEDRYNGFEINELVNINIKNKTYFIAGFGLHFNKENYIREFHIKKVIIPFVTLGTGLKFSELLKAEIQYQVPINREYKTSDFNGPASYRLSKLVKFSLGFELPL